jgi:RNA-directed DNA polymerase
MSLATPEKIQKLQRALYLKAKQEPTYRFYCLHDKVCRADILSHAYALSRFNGGASGVDGVRFEDIEEYGRERFLVEVRQELQGKRYRSEAVRRVMIPKPNGGERPLGIPTIKDRVMQAAVKLVLEPIFEADFTDNAYGYRPNRSAVQAVREVHRTLKAGYVQVVDADLSKFLDTIPHAELMRSIARRVADGAVLHLIRMWLKSPVEQETEAGRRTRTSMGNRGTPQGGVVSPLLANIYMRRFLKAWEMRSNDRKLSARIVNYADDFVILCRRNAEQALAEASSILSRIGLTISEQKTKVCQAWEQPFDFLGYSFGPQYSFESGQKYMAAYPSAKSLRRLRVKLRSMTGSHMTWQDADKVVSDVNRVVQGWTNYFHYGTLWKAYVKVERFLQQRLCGWLVRKHKVDSRGECRFPATYVYDTLRLLNPLRTLKPLRMQ